MTLILEPLRVCRVCGLEVWTENNLELLKGNYTCLHGRENLCKECRKDIDKAYSKTPMGRAIHTKSRRKWEKDNPEKFKKAVQKYRSTTKYKEMNNDRIKQSRKRDPEKWKVINKRGKEKLKREVFEKLSNPPKCAHCPSADVRVLTVDHINDNGAQERSKLGHDDIFRKIRDMPLEEARKEYQLLCRNCNWIKYLESKKVVRQER